MYGLRMAVYREGCLALACDHLILAVDAAIGIACGK
jgi:hypothetical protein